jgi:hypothetical protein
MALLETLFEQRALTGIGPILRNPRLNALLADNARFRTLKTRLEAELMANRVA